MFDIPKYVNNLLNKLEESGFQAFIVGGSVRDMLLGVEPTDYDITTDATPGEIEQVFLNYKIIQVGKQFGTVVVVQKEGMVEITTYRTEGRYIDGRRPSQISFTKDIKEDLSRRDFTINAMAYNKDTGIIDLYNGREDIDKRIIRSVGNPKKRFMEDHLRILRAIRFSTQLNFTIDRDTYRACKELSPYLSYISMERIRDEIFKVVLSKRPSQGIKLMKDLGVLHIAIPEILDTIEFNQRNPNHDKDVFEHTLCVLDRTSPIIHLRLAALFHDIAKPQTLTIDDNGVGHFYGHHVYGAEIAKDILTRLKCSKDLINRTMVLIKEHMTVHSDMKEKGLKRQISRVGEDNIFTLLELQMADRLCSKDGTNIDFIKERETQIKEIINREEAYEKNQLNINGKDIIELGYSEGKIIGDILDYLMEKVLEKPELNKKEILEEIVRRLTISN